MNIGRFVTAAAVLLIGTQFTGNYSDIGAACALIYGLGMLVAFWAPNTAGKSL
jgi:hypothetical protein